MEGNMKPIYRQIEDYIMDNIHNSKYQQGMMIPSEEEFCEKFHTSRMTVRKALDSLTAKGVLHKMKGKGTFVSKFNIEKTMNSIGGWKQTMQAAGHKTKSELLRIAMEKADEQIAKNLNLEVGRMVYVIERLRYADDVPVLIEQAHLNAAMLPKLLEHEFLDDSLYDVLEKEYDIHIHHVYQKLRTKHVFGEYARLLFDEDEAVAMIMENTSFDTYTQPVEYTICYINGEKYALRYVVNN